MQMGIRKRAHQKKLVKAVDRLTLLMEQGRTPEGEQPDLTNDLLASNNSPAKD